MAEDLTKVIARKLIDEEEHVSEVITELGNSVKDTPVPYLYSAVEYEHDPNLPTVVCVTGLTGSGKDRIVDELIGEGVFHQVITATTRDRRYCVDDNNAELVRSILSGCHDPQQYNDTLDFLESEHLVHDVEPRGKYVWMRRPNSDEFTTETEGYFANKEHFKSILNIRKYHDNLIREYNLVESDAHYNGLYGLPMASLVVLKDIHEVPVIRTDIHGAETITSNLQGKWNVLTIALVTDSWQQCKDAIAKREKGNDVAAKIESRLRDDKNSLALFPKVANFIIQNTWYDVNGGTGLEHTLKSFRLLLANYVFHNLQGRNGT